MSTVFLGHSYVAKMATMGLLHCPVAAKGGMKLKHVYSEGPQEHLFQKKYGYSVVIIVLGLNDIKSGMSATSVAKHML